MAEFIPITIETQEQLDGMFKDRLNRQNDKHSKEIAELKAQFADYEELKANKDGYDAQITELNAKLDEANEKLNGYNSQIAERDAQIADLKVNSYKERAIRVFNLTDDAIEFLHGGTEEEVNASAEKLSKLTPKTVIAPLAGNEQPISDANSNAYRTMLNNLF